jgi:Flp pilus assembly protein CpaB
MKKTRVISVLALAVVALLGLAGGRMLLTFLGKGNTPTSIPDVVADTGRTSPVIEKESSLAADLFKDLKEPGYAAMTIPIVRESVPMGGVLPGTRLDILANVPASDDPSQFVSQVIVENVRVLAICTMREDPEIESGDGKLTVAVTPEQAQKLSASSKHGSFTIVLRRPAE